MPAYSGVARSTTTASPPAVSRTILSRKRSDTKKHVYGPGGRWTHGRIGRLSNECLDRCSVDRTYGRAASQPRLAARDDDPLTFHLEKSEFQRAAVCVAVEKLRVPVAQARHEAQRSASELVARAAPDRVRDKLPIRSVNLVGRCGFPVCEVLLNDGKEPAGDHQAIRRLQRRPLARAGRRHRHDHHNRNGAETPQPRRRSDRSRRDEALSRSRPFLHADAGGSGSPRHRRIYTNGRKRRRGTPRAVLRPIRRRLPGSHFNLRDLNQSDCRFSTAVS